MENAPARLLIIDTAWLGDVVFTTALVGAVKRSWPATEVHVLVAPRGEAIMRHHPHVTKLWVFDKHGRERSFASLRKVAHSLGDERFDVVLNAHPSTRSRLLTRLVRAPVSVGYAGFGSRFCFNHTVSNDLALEPDHVERRINLLRVLRPEAVAGPLSVGLDPEATRWTEGYFASAGGVSAPLLALICGSAWETKRWPAEHFGELARRWSSSRGGRVLVIGGSVERAEVELIVRMAGPHATALLQEPLPHVAALLARCAVTVGNDTGVTFLAMAAGCPKVIALYGSTQVNYRFPSPHQALLAGVPCCLPRTGHGAHRCRWTDGSWCMNQLGVDRVWKSVTE